MPELNGERVTLRPLEAGDAETLLTIHRTPEVARWWGQPDDGFPMTDEPEATRFAILIDGRVAGMVQYSEEPEPDYRYAEIDIFLDPAEHGRGAGTDAVRVIVGHLVEDHGHHRVTLATAVENVVALRCYEKAGFRRIGVAQAAGRNYVTGEMDDEWLLERVVLPPKDDASPVSPRATMKRIPARPESAMTSDRRILLISGSLRAASTNTALLRTLVGVSPAGVRAEPYGEMGKLPHFNPDDDPVDGPVDARVAAFREQLAAADALMFCTPEYAGALPGSLKNLLDWSVGGGETYGMPVAWTNVSGPAAPTGGAGAHDSLRAVLTYTGSVIIDSACLRLPLTRADVGDDGLVADPEARRRASKALTELARAVGT